MNGAQALINTLVDGGVDVCFANPGTSEMHFVAALDTVSQMRGVLALFEGVATGAADGYARIADRPAAVLLHLGPGLGNGLANLHNARRAQVPDGRRRRRPRHLPQEVRRPTGIRYRCARRQRLGLGAPDSVPPPTSRSTRPRPISACRAGSHISTLILPADASWSDGAQPATPRPAEPAAADPLPAPEVLEVLRSGEPTVIMVGGDATRGPGLGRGRPDRRGNRRPAAVRDIPDSAGAWRRHPRRRPAGVLRRGRRGPARRRQASGAGRAPNRRCPSSPTRTCPATWYRPAVRCTCSPSTAAPPTRWRPWPTSWRPGPPPPVAAASRPQLPIGCPDVGVGGRGDRRAAARTGDRRRRVEHLRVCCCRRPPREHRPMTG